MVYQRIEANIAFCVIVLYVHLQQQQQQQQVYQYQYQYQYVHSNILSFPTLFFRRIFFMSIELHSP